MDTWDDDNDDEDYYLLFVLLLVTMWGISLKDCVEPIVQVLKAALSFELFGMPMHFPFNLDFCKKLYSKQEMMTTNLQIRFKMLCIRDLKV